MALEVGMDDDIEKVVPSPEELQIVGHRNQGSWKCPEVGCLYVATNASILGLHKSQVHNFRTRHRKGTENVHYHCPVSDCYFNPQSERHFKNIDTLRTHYMKVHSEKKFVCAKCNKTFGLERDCHRHETECGENFDCSTCGKVYTNKSALRRHCDYNGHHNRAKETKAKAVKEPRSKPAKILNKVKVKPLTSAMNTRPFILPKEMLPKTTSLQTHSLHIQTDALGSQFFISKMASHSSTSQGVQTVDRISTTRSAGIQTTLDLLSRSTVETSYQTERLSTGIQTTLSDLDSLNNSLCVAQTQTGTSILQQAMTKASIPVVNVCKGTQKSPVGHKRRKKSNTSCTTGSQTFCSSTLVKKRHAVSPDSSQLFLDHAVISPDKEAQNRLSGSMDFLMSSMSTQTSVSCVSEQIFPKFYSAESGSQLQDCHTQTQGNIINDIQATSLYNDQNILPRGFVPYSDQITQTKSFDFSVDQNTQTGNSNLCSNVPFGFLAIQDNQTQTAHDPLNSGVIHSSQTQTRITGFTNTAQFQDQGTTCDELLSLSEGELSNFSKGEFSLDDSGMDFLLGDKNGSPEKCLRTSGSSNDLTDLLMEVINSDISCVDICPSDVINSKNPDQSISTGRVDLCGNDKTGHKKVCLPVVSMETQTFGNLGMDCMTQTIEDLGWDMSTQTVDYLLTDMMTQTGDDFLESLTNDTHTQTVDDFCMNVVLNECLGTSGTPELDSIKQTGLQGLFGDHVSTQTIWDTDDQTLDLHSSSFASSAFRNPAQDIAAQPGLYLEKEQNTDEYLNSYTETSTSNVIGKWDSVLSSDTSSELGRDTETTETQTMYDPLFYYLTGEDTLSFNSKRKIKYLESSHTQTTQDPMLTSVVSDDDPVPFFSQSIFAQKETETQTGSDYHFPVSRETAECQTPWDKYLTSVGTSETQTQNAELFGVSCSDTQTQTILEPGLMTNLDLTNSFTQTNIDQNTQTGSIY